MSSNVFRVSFVQSLHGVFFNLDTVLKGVLTQNRMMYYELQIKVRVENYKANKTQE